MILLNRTKKMFSKPLFLALLVSISLNITFGYLSYSFYSGKAVAESQLEVALVSNGFLNISLERKTKACLVQDAIAAENQTEQLLIVKEKDAVLDAIDKMASVSRVKQNIPKRVVFPKEKDNVNETNIIASLDDMLPDALVSLLNESCNRSKGSSCIQP